jgi:hypothetical protein
MQATNMRSPANVYTNWTVAEILDALAFLCMEMFCLRSTVLHYTHLEGISEEQYTNVFTKKVQD